MCPDRVRAGASSRNGAVNRSDFAGRLDHESPKVFSGRCIRFVVVAVHPCRGRGLAAVARAESGWRLERDRRREILPGRWVEGSLASAGGARLVKSGGGPGPGLPDRYAVGEAQGLGAYQVLQGNDRQAALESCLRISLPGMGLYP